MTPPGVLPTKVYCRTILSTLAEVDLLCKEIRALLASTDLAEMGFAIELLARECLCNAVIHGNHRNADKKIELDMRTGKVWVRLQVTDEGNGFEWRKRCLLPEDTGETSGRGLPLYALFADRIQFNNSGNRITLWIRRNEKVLERS